MLQGGRIHPNNLTTPTNRPVKLFRYRRRFLKTLLGITKAKKRIKKELGITDAMKPFRWRPSSVGVGAAWFGAVGTDRVAEAGWVFGDGVDDRTCDGNRFRDCAIYVQG
jgi:hypothetical protein